MADTKTEKTVADELREAATKLRQAAEHVPGGEWTLHEDLIDHGNSCESAILTDARDGMDRLILSGDWDSEGLAAMGLLVTLHGVAEPLASWLESAAVWHDETTVVLTDPNHVLHHACGGVAGEDCACFAHPLAVARVLNGSAQ